MSIIGAVLLVLVIILTVLALGGTVLLLLAYGLGLLVSWFAHFEPFQSTILALAAILAAGILAEHVGRVILNDFLFPLRDQPDNEEGDDDFYDDDDVLKQIDFSDVAPNTRCPCGSGRKYKNCHGAKKTTTPF